MRLSPNNDASVSYLTTLPALKGIFEQRTGKQKVSMKIKFVETFQCRREEQ